MLKRKIAKLIEEHLRSGTERILLIDGARQVGKTYIIRYVGKKLFPNFIEINMLEDSNTVNAGNHPEFDKETYFVHG